MRKLVTAVPRALAERLSGRRRPVPEPEHPALDTALAGELLREDLDALQSRIDDLATAETDPRRTAAAAEATEACSDVQRLLARPTPEAVTAAAVVLCRGWQAAALAESAEVPTPRSPCLFDPRHGMATTEHVWTSSRHGTRMVPVCGFDDGRLAAGLEPDVRTVDVGGRRKPYFDAGEPVRPYLEGYFPATSMEWVRSPLWTRPSPRDEATFRAAGSNYSDSPNAGDPGPM